MNRTDRLLAIILQLQAKGWQRAEDLAAHFEVSKRTIYRDVQALDEAGVPLIATPGQGYSLVEGYFLPLLSFTADEATMLLLGADLMRQSFDAEYRKAAQSAEDKINGVLPNALQAKVQWLRDSLRFISPEFNQPEEAASLQVLRRAVVRQQTVRFIYRAKSGEDPAGTPTLREADPYTLTHVEGSWYLTAYCHLRHDLRNFRLNRIDNLQLTNRTFKRAPFTFEAFSGRMLESRTLTVRLLFAPEVKQWVLEDRFFFITEKIEIENGLLVTLHIRCLEDVLQWVLSWGQHVQVLEPDALRERLRAEIEAMLSNIASTENLSFSC